jgi:histidine triad (HIT) family protein
MDCLFCKIAQKTIPAHVVFEDEQLLAFKDVKPQAPTHLLIIPKKHIATLNDAHEEDSAILGKMIITAKQLAQNQELSESGYRLVLNTNSGGGQAVYHIHLHLLGGRQMTWPPG